MHKVLVLGGSGLVGRAIANEMSKYKEFQIYTTHFKNPMKLNSNRSFKLNIEDSDSLNSILNNLKPQSIVSCLRGTYDKQLLLHIKIAQYLKKRDGRLYFCSTTNVFDNNLSKPHDEDALPNSCTDYGKYKIECEKRIIEILNNNACILRLPQVWGKDSPRMNHLLKSLNNNEKIVVYPKLFFNTNTDIEIAKKVSYIIRHKLKGTFHLAADDVINHKEFYSELLLGLGFKNERLINNFEEEGYFALLSKRNSEFPVQLRLKNESVIKHLITSVKRCAN